MPSSAVTRATAASTAASSDTSACTASARTSCCVQLGRQRLQLVAGAGAVVRRIGVGSGDVEAGHVRPAPGQCNRGGPADAAGAGRAGHQRDAPDERAHVQDRV